MFVLKFNVSIYIVMKFFPMEWTFFPSLPFFDIVISIASLPIFNFILSVHTFNGFSQKRFCQSYPLSWNIAFCPIDDCILFDSIEHLPTIVSLFLKCNNLDCIYIFRHLIFSWSFIKYFLSQSLISSWLKNSRSNENTRPFREKSLPEISAC